MTDAEEIKFYEIEFKDGYSMAIKGIRQPTVTEAQDFYDKTIGLDKTGLAKTDATTVVNVLDMTDKTTRNLVLALVRRRGERCKSVGADNIVSANIGLNLYNGGPIRVNAVVKRGDRRQEVTIAARKATNYGKTSPKILDACARIHGEDRTHAISRLIRQS